MRALQEPHKVFEGQQLHISIANDWKSKTNQEQVQQQQQVKQPSQDQMLAAVAAAQNLALFGQYPGLNPMYGGLLGNPGTAWTPAGIIGSIMAGAMSQGLAPASQVGGLRVATQSVLGTYGTGRGSHHVYYIVHRQALGGVRGLLGHLLDIHHICDDFQAELEEWCSCSLGKYLSRV